MGTPTAIGVMKGCARGLRCLVRTVSGDGSTATAGFLPNVDVLRAVAIAGVVAYHVLPAAAPGGLVGVGVEPLQLGGGLHALVQLPCDCGEGCVEAFTRCGVSSTLQPVQRPGEAVQQTCER